MNQLYSQMMTQQLTNNPQLQQLKDLANALKSSNNPMQMLQNNPNYKMIMDSCNKEGISPKQMATNLARQRGIDIEQFMSMFR